MLHLERLPDRDVLVITPDGALEKTDFERLAKELESFIASKGRLGGIMVCAESFPGWASLGALVSHLKFIVGHHRQIDRIAVVTKSRFVKTMPRFAGYFVHPTIRSFDFEEKDRALAWLETKAG